MPGILENIGVSKKLDVKHQLFAHDSDNSLEFRQLKVEMAHLVEYQGDKAVAAYWHKYQNEYWFPGFKSIPAGYITPSFERDTVLQVHEGILANDELPYSKDGKLDEGPISEIAKNKCYQLDSEVKVSMASNKITNAFIVIDIVLLFCLAFKVVT